MKKACFHHGFTLVEVLIAVTLLSMLMLVLTSALYGMGQVEDRVEQRIADADDFRATVNLLGDVLGRVSARRFPVQRADAPAQAPFFQAAEDSLAWVGVMPARIGVGGRHYMRLSVERDQIGSALVLRYAPWSGAPGYDAWEQAQAQPLAAPVTAVHFRYQDPGTGQWTAVWPPPDVDIKQLPESLIPGAVEIQVEGPVPAWPPIILRTTVTRMSDPRGQGGSFGGR